MESLRREIKELELEIWERHRRRSLKGLPRDHDSKSEHTGGSSHQDHSWLSRNKSNESKGKRLCHPREKGTDNPTLL